MKPGHGDRPVLMNLSIRTYATGGSTPDLWRIGAVIGLKPPRV
jgi:hypothetical protein